MKEWANSPAAAEPRWRQRAKSSIQTWIWTRRRFCFTIFSSVSLRLSCRLWRTMGVCVWMWDRGSFSPHPARRHPHTCRTSLIGGWNQAWVVSMTTTLILTFLSLGISRSLHGIDSLRRPRGPSDSCELGCSGFDWVKSTQSAVQKWTLSQADLDPEARYNRRSVRKWSRFVALNLVPHAV